MTYDAIVIGAGTAGLASALVLSNKGKKVLVLEKQPVPGGFATTFKRKGFTFEGAVHCVDALAPGEEVREFLKANGVENRIDFIDLKDFARIIYPEHDLVADFDCEGFKGYLKEKFPEEAAGIDRLFCAFEKFFRQFDAFDSSKLPGWLNFALTPIIYPSIIACSIKTVDQFISKYIKDAKLAAIITDIWRFLGLPARRLSAFYFLIVFRGYFCKPTCYVKGATPKIFQAMVEKIRENGSEVRFGVTVKQVRTKNNRVSSVVCDKQDEFFAKSVISNANAIDTLTKILDDEKLKLAYLKQLCGLEKSASAFQVYLGLNKPAAKLGMTSFLYSINTSYEHETDFNKALSGDHDNCSIEIVDHSRIDPGLVPEGKGSLIIMAFDSYANWKSLNKQDYEAKKKATAEKLIRRTEKYLPGLTDSIEVMELATPLTMECYGTSPEGAIYGFAQTPLQASINRFPQKTKIKGLFLAGAWTFPGHGIHGCFVSGKEAGELALKFLK